MESSGASLFMSSFFFTCHFRHSACLFSFFPPRISAFSPSQRPVSIFPRLSTSRRRRSLGEGASTSQLLYSFSLITFSALPLIASFSFLFLSLRERIEVRV